MVNILMRIYVLILWSAYFVGIVTMPMWFWAPFVLAGRSHKHAMNSFFDFCQKAEEKYTR